MKLLTVLQDLLNLLIIGIAWHFVVFLLGTRCGNKMFDEHKKRYQCFKWEKEGKFYQKYFKINSWKDKLPQHIGKEDGAFSKEHIDGKSVEYMNMFIMETCRAEWIHSAGLLFAIVLLLIAPNYLKIYTFIAMIFIQMPFIIIQRYNRFRLVKYRKRLLIEEERKAKRKKLIIENN